MLSTKPAEVSLLVSLLDMYFNDRESYKKLVQKSVVDKNRLSLAESGWLTPMDIAMACIKLDTREGKGVGMSQLETALQRLWEWGYVKLENMPGTMLAGCWRINDAAEKLWDKAKAENICFGVLHLIEKYRNSVPYVVVETKEGDEEIGTGFLVTVGRQHICVTNKHVTTGTRIKRIKAIQADAKKLKWSMCVESQSYDLAAIVISNAHDLPTFKFGIPILLDDVIALGYPKVAVTAEPFLLAHKGEINGTIVNRCDNQRYLAVSCAVAPGNSGGPLINEAAEVVGVISQSSVFRGMESTVEQVGVHHLAIPFDDVLAFLSSSEVLELVQSSEPQMIGGSP
jgi:S1-C subfamily serine protease